MRLAVCALSAVLLSGCSWLGMGGNSSGHHGAGVYGANCGGYNTGGAYGMSAGSCGGAGFDQAGYGQQGFGGQQFPGQGFNQQGFGGQQFAQQGYGQQGFDVSGFQGASQYGGVTLPNTYSAGGGYNTAALGLGAAGAYGAAGYGQTTTLGANAPWGSAVGGSYGAQYGQQFGTQGNVTTVAGAPIYVPQPYPAYYGAPQLRGVPVAVSGGGAMPFGIEAGIGTNFFQNGDFVTAKPAGPASGSSTISVSATDAIGYKDAFKEGTHYDLAATYDLDRNTTVLGRFGYGKASGEIVETGTVTDATGTETLFAEFSDLEQMTIEGGVRRYFGGWNNPNGGLRPYVGAMGGFTHTDDVSLSQFSSGTILPNGSNVQPYVDGGWSPTAAGLVGAEWQVGRTTALGLETGIRWTDDLNTPNKTQDAISIPVRLRGRVSF